MARVAVIAPREAVGESLARALRESASVAACDWIPHEAGGMDAPSLGSVDVVVYAAEAVGATGGGPDVAATRAICERLASLPLKHVVIVSSAAVYAASHQNVGLLDENAFVRGGRSALADAWLRVEELGALIGARSGTAPPVRTVLRPAAVLDGANYFSRLLRGGVAVTYPGHDPTLQLLSPRDLAAAVASVVSARAEGVFNVAPKGGIPLVKALRLAGAFRLPLPRLAQNLVRKATAPTRLTATTDQLQYIQFSWTVSGEKLRTATGFAPSLSSADAIAELTERCGSSAVFDDFGMDPGYIRRYCGHLFHFLHDYYWRVEIHGIENVPLTGRGVLVGMHRGFMPFDGVMALYALVLQRDRIPRFLIHPSLTKFPFLADFMARLGGIMACQENGDYVLRHDELLGVFPEGIRGAFTMYKRAYTLGKFGRDEFVRMALRNRAPILPFVTVGSAEIYPILRRVDWAWFKRRTEWPFLPLTASPFPLPSKWHTQFLPPLHIERDYPPEAAEDPETVRRISVEVRQRMQAAVDQMLVRRRSIFRGSIFGAASES